METGRAEPGGVGPARRSWGGAAGRSRAAAAAGAGAAQRGVGCVAPCCGMSKTLRKKRHWLSKVQECVVSWGGPAGPDPDLLRGGAERGEFPYLAGRLPAGGEDAPGPVLLSGKAPAPGDVLLEVNGTPVSGLTHRDTLAVVRHFREPVRLKTVRPGERPPPPSWTEALPPPPSRPRVGLAAPAPCGAVGGPRREAAPGGNRAESGARVSRWESFRGFGKGALPRGVM